MFSTCKDAIKCRPWAPPPLSYTSSEPISNIFTFLESLGQMTISGQLFLFLFRKLKTPFLVKKKSTNLLKCGVVALFMRDYCNSYTKKVWSCRVWSFFPVLRYCKLTLSKNQNHVFLSFGVSATTPLLIILLINVAYFLNRLFNAHLSTYQTVPSSIFDFWYGFVFLPKKGS